MRKPSTECAKLVITTMKENHALAGCLLIKAYDLKGNLLREIRQPNLITNQGRLLVAQLFSGEIQGIDRNSISMAIGTGSATPSAEDHQLGAQVAEAQVKTSPAGLTGQGNSQTVSLKLSANFPPLPQEGESIQAITEAGVLLKSTNSPTQTLYNRVIFPAVNRTNQLSLSLSWEVTF